ncbi:hypothetical protein [Pseudomonas sp. RC10]|uniref:hypothetical protein n=1 Tax=Pseudomonas bambusae TaxID=3139142 RepID=UPI003138689D
MNGSIHLPPSNVLPFDKDSRFSAVVNGKPFITTRLQGIACLRSELEGVQTRQIWKIHATGKVAHRRTVFGFFIDQSLQPGTYDLVRNERVSAVYHLTPKQQAMVFHSRDFQDGTLTLLECNVETGRLRGTFEFSIPAIDFNVTRGEFNLVCRAGKAIC